MKKTMPVEMLVESMGISLERFQQWTMTNLTSSETNVLRFTPAVASKSPSLRFNTDTTLRRSADSPLIR